MARCFAENAVVIDERREHRGPTSHRALEGRGYGEISLHKRPLTVDVSGADVIVIARVTGDFPGSPVELRYRFTLEGDKIARLEIMG